MTEIRCRVIECLFNDRGKCVRQRVDLELERNRIYQDGELGELRLICVNYRQ